MCGTFFLWLFVPRFVIIFLFCLSARWRNLHQGSLSCLVKPAPSGERREIATFHPHNVIEATSESGKKIKPHLWSKTFPLPAQRWTQRKTQSCRRWSSSELPRNVCLGREIVCRFMEKTHVCFSMCSSRVICWLLAVKLFLGAWKSKLNHLKLEKLPTLLHPDTQ